MKRPARVSASLVALCALATACGTSAPNTSTPDAATAADATPATDATPITDASSATDATPIPDAAPLTDAAPATDASAGCVADNSPAAVAQRGGFFEVCADPVREPRAMCGDGSPYRFTYRRAAGASRGLMVFFQGGGACTDYVSCWGNDGVGGTGRRVVTMSNNRPGPQLDPTTRRPLGIMDAMEPTNPLANYDVVFGAYCTGDLGQGSRDEVLTRPADAPATAPMTITTRFHGGDNVAAVLAFAQRTFPSPARVVVTGSSAGSYTSLASVIPLAMTYPATTRIVYLGDAGAGIGIPTYDAQFDALVTRFDGHDGGRVVRFAQMSFQADRTQRAFTTAGFRGAAAFQAALRTTLEGRATRHPMNFRYFAPPGDCHTALPNAALFERYVMGADGTFAPATPAERPNPVFTLDGVGIGQWIRALVEPDASIGADARNLAGPWSTVSEDCPLPGVGAL